MIPSSSARTETQPRVQLFDIGSNSTHWACWSIEAGRLPALLRVERAALPLGRPQSAEQREALLQTATEALGAFMELGASMGAERTLAAATASLRLAPDGAAIRERWRAALGLDVRILSAKEEALSGWLGATCEVEDPRAAHWAFDLGGRSTELAQGSGGSLRRWVSLPWGHLSLAELRASGETVWEQALAALLPSLRALEPAQGEIRLWGLGGSARALARMAAARRGDPSEGASISRAELAQLTEQLGTLPAEQIRLLPGFDPRREGTLWAAASFSSWLLEALGVSGWQLPKHGFRRGLLEMGLRGHLPFT